MQAPGQAFARAKINLTLEVRGRRPDGYHELESLVVFAEIGDRLTFSPAEIFTLDLKGPFAASLPRAEENLVLRAARGLSTLAGGGRGASILLEKNLPAAGGIGGGSADAAATLRGLVALWGRDDLPRARLMTLAAELGADVPVCLDARASRVGGVGERLVPVPRLPAAWLVLVNPGRALATGAVFAARRGPFSVPAAELPALSDAPALAAWLRAAGNDLEAPARTLLPEIGDVLAALADTAGCLLARMSGSGASCFGLYGDETAARAAAAAISARRPAWWVRPSAIARG